MGFLGISESYTNKEWVGPSDQNWQKALLISKDLFISQLSAYQLIKNKINEKDYLGYISPKIKNLVPNPKMVNIPIIANIIAIIRGVLILSPKKMRPNIIPQTGVK